MQDVHVGVHAGGVRKRFCSDRAGAVVAAQGVAVSDDQHDRC